MDGFQGLGSILGYLEVVGVMVCSFAERAAVGQWGCKVPALNYTQLTLCLLGSSYLSTVALDQINYPTKVSTDTRQCRLGLGGFVLASPCGLVLHVTIILSRRLFSGRASSFRLWWWLF
jgi:hypothetical protein